MSRIRRTRAKIGRAAERHFARGGPGKKVVVEVSVLRLPTFRGGNWHYSGQACFKTIGEAKSCGVVKYGRTPQSAIAKALKSISTKVALRGRRAPR